ncbi:O-antigen ligase family protein [Patescibacteria group bacterium]|nr:O-antigen ligase family protein [Patescibacteria group bacterium]
MTTDSFYKKLVVISLLGLAFVPIVITSNTLVALIIAKIGFIRLMIVLAWVALVTYLFRGRDVDQSLDWKFLKSPLFTSILVFTALAGISTLLAVNPYRSFFGTLERGGGYIHLLYMLAFFVVVSLIFQKKEWLQFFKASLVTGAIISTDAIWFYVQTGDRALGTFLGNPAYISAYLLFVIFSALAVLVYESRQGWRRFSYVALVFSVIGLVVSSTRGAMLGLIVALLVVAFYLAVKGNGARTRLLGRYIGIRKLATSFLILLVLFAVLFVLTMNSPIWKKIPGLNRFAELSIQDETIQSRVVAAKISLASVNPASADFSRTLLGWGPENYNLAFNQYFDPEIQRYETKLFDRAHNQVLDVLVMNGLLGLIAYLFIWFFVLRVAITASLGDGDKRKEILLRSSMIFFGTAYFVQNLAFFDQISTYIPVFAFWGFSSYLSQRGRSEPNRESAGGVPKWAATALVIFLVGSFYWTAFVPYRQTSKLTEGLRKQNPTFIVEQLSTITTPFNYAQTEIRRKLVLTIGDIIDHPKAKPLVEQSWALLEEIILMEPQEPRNIEALAVSYETYGENSKSPELLKRAEELLKQELELVPGRQGTLFLLAKSLLAQGRLEEALNVADDILATDPESVNANLYYSMITVPLDWDGMYGTEKLLEDLFYEDSKAFNIYVEISSEHISYYRNMHRLYLNYYYEQRNEIAFRNILLKSIEMEDVLQRIQIEQIPNGYLDEPIESMRETLERALTSFDQFGWSNAGH